MQLIDKKIQDTEYDNLNSIGHKHELFCITREVHEVSITILVLTTRGLSPESSRTLASGFEFRSCDSFTRGNSIEGVSWRFFSSNLQMVAIIVRGALAISSHLCFYDASSSRDVITVNDNTVWFLMLERGY